MVNLRILVTKQHQHGNIYPLQVSGGIMVEKGLHLC